MKNIIYFTHPDQVKEECIRMEAYSTGKEKTIYEGINWMLSTGRDSGKFLEYCFNGDAKTWHELIDYLLINADNNVNSVWHTTNEFFNKKG